MRAGDPYAWSTWAMAVALAAATASIAISIQQLVADDELSAAYILYETIAVGFLIPMVLGLRLLLYRDPRGRWVARFAPLLAVLAIGIGFLPNFIGAFLSVGDPVDGRMWWLTTLTALLASLAAFGVSFAPALRAPDAGTAPGRQHR